MPQPRAGVADFLVLFDCPSLDDFPRVAESDLSSVSFVFALNITLLFGIFSIVELLLFHVVVELAFW